MGATDVAPTQVMVPLLRRPAGRRRSFVNQRRKTGRLAAGTMNNVRVTNAKIIAICEGKISLKKVETWSTVFIPKCKSPQIRK